MPITDPTDITGCVLWLDPGTLALSDGDPVGTWTDQSGSGNDATSAGTDRPTYRDGGDFYHAEPTIEYSSQAHRLEVAADASLANGEVTYAIVCRLTDIEAHADPKWLINKINTNASTVGIRVADEGIANEGLYEAFYRLAASPSTVRTIQSIGPVRESWISIIFRYDGSEGQMWINGQLTDEQTNTGALDTASNGALVIGNHSTSDLAFEGHIGEVVVYDNAISDADLGDLADWLAAKYPNSEYVKVGPILSTGNRHARIRSASDTGEDDHQMLVLTTGGAVNHYTAPTSDPHNWTLANSTVIPTDTSYRTLDFFVVSGTWYVYVDRAASNGQIELWTGSSVTSLSEHASSPVLTGSAGNYLRTPGVFCEAGAWTMLVDVRTDSITGGLGHIDRYTSSDGVSWTKDTTNSPVISPSGDGWEGSDVGHPMIYKQGTNDYLLVYAGFNTDHPLGWDTFPHEIGMATSTNLATWTKVATKNPIFSIEDESTDFDNAFVANPCLFNDGNKLNLYYSGGNTSTTIRLGYAEGDETSGLVTRDAENTFSWDNVIAQTSFSFPVANVFAWDNEAEHNFIYLDVGNEFSFDDGGGYDWELDIVQYIGFVGPRTVKSVTNSLAFSDVAAIGVEEDCENEFNWDSDIIRAHIATNSLSFTITVGAFQEEDILQDLALSDSADSSGSTYERDQTDGFIKQNLSFSIGGACLEKEYAPQVGSSDDDSYGEVSTTPPTLTVDSVIFTYPVAVPTHTLNLKNPTFNNTDELEYSRIDRETRGGDRILFSDPKWGTTETLSMTFANVCDPDTDSVVDFINESLGKEVGFRDWEGRDWTGVIVAPRTEITQTVGGYSVTIVFQGELA